MSHEPFRGLLSEYRDLGNRAVSNSHCVTLECHHCKVFWNGCAAECGCPECGAPKEYWETGKCLCEECRGRRIVLCEACGSEGRVLSGHPNDPYPRDEGPCPYCEGTGSEVIETQPVELEDLEPLIPADTGAGDVT